MLEMKVKKVSLLLFLVILVALALRIFGITWGLPNQDYYFSYHPDEIHYLKGLSLMNPAKLDFNPHYFNWGTWHYYELGAVIGLASVLGIVNLNKDKHFYYFYPWEMAKIYLVGRFLSVFFALATVILVYLIGKKIYGVKAGLLAAFFLAINPGHIIHSHYLKADASVTFWVTLLLFSCLYLLETGRLIWYLLSGIILAFATGAQHNGICFSGAIFFAHCLREYKNSGWLSFIKKYIFSRNLWLGYTAALIAYLIVSPYLLLSSSEFMSGITDAFLGRSGGINTIDRANIFSDTFKAMNLGLSPFFTILGLAGVMFGILSRKKTNLLLAIWLLPYLSFSIIRGTLNTRHQLLMYPGLLLLSSGFIYYIFRRIKTGFSKSVLIICVVLASFYTVCYSLAYDMALTGKTVQQQASEWIIRNIPPKTKIGIFMHPEIMNSPTVIHQVFYYKQGPDYIIKDLKCDNDIGCNVDSLRREDPEYIIISKREGFGFPKESFQIEWLKDFIEEIVHRYEIIKVFERYPSLFGLQFKPKIFISDWEIPFPVIYILRKRNN